jgi:hypothetical protein
VNPNPADHIGPQYRGAHFAYHEDNFINMHHNKHSLLQPQYNTYGLPRKSASNPLLRIPSDLMSSSPAPKPAPLQNTRNGGNNAQQKPTAQKPDSMEDFSRDLEAELNKLLQDDGDDDSTASLQESDSISRSHLSSTNSSRGNLFSPFITDAGSQTEDEAVTPNGVIYDPYWEAHTSPSNHSPSGLVPRAASWGQLNTSSLYVNVNNTSDELSAMNSPHRIALSPQTRNLGLGSRPPQGMNSGHQRSASLGTVNIKNMNMTPANQLVTPLITPPSTTPPQSLTLSNDLFDPLDSSSDSNTRLFFKALPPELDNYPFLLQTFIKYGDVKSLTCNSKRRFALVEFGTRVSLCNYLFRCTQLTRVIIRTRLCWQNESARRFKVRVVRCTA